MRHNTAMRIIKQLLQYLSLTLVMLTPASSFAVEADDTPWYEIELIIFEPVDPPVTTEKWPAVIEEPVLDNAVELLPPAGPQVTPAAFQQLDASRLQLTPQVKRLTAGNRYRVLLHTGWRQPLQENGPGTPVYISSLPRSARPGNNPETVPESYVDGVITLLLTRYLHFKAHLVYTNPEVDLARQISQQDNSSAVIERFVMKESRRVKRQELHYFDHPYFGMVARVIRYEPPQPQPVPAASQ